MPGFDEQTVWGANLNFSDPTSIQFDHPGEFINAGDIAIGTGLADPFQQIMVAHLVGAGGITINPTPGGGNITIDGSGAGGSLTVHTDAGDALEAAGAISIVGAGTVSTSAVGSTITITGAGGGGMTWQAISASQTLAVNHGYFCTGGAALALLLPPVSALGDTIEIYIDGSASFQVTQGAGQTIKFGNQVTSGGAGGSITSTGQGDGITMVCRTANLRWLITDCMGNLTFV
jgi:hypothetical protein